MLLRHFICRGGRNIKNSWAARKNPCQDFVKIIEELSGSTEEEILFPTDTSPDDIENMTNAARCVLNAIKTGEKIYVFGDYDADGVCSMAILFLLLSHLKNEIGSKSEITIRAPRRLSEGYGISQKAVDEVEEGLLITVDNGISAVQEITKAKEKGITVIVLDHHLPGNDIPPADIIVDPHLHPQNNGFEDFCGAGLAFKLAESLITDEELTKKLSAIATIGTIADVVKLHGANRVIVQKGLRAMNARQVTQGLKSLIEACEFTSINEENVAFKLAPVLNAPGRLHDDGARYSSACLAQDKKPIHGLAQQLVAVNEDRKRIVNEAYDIVMKSIELPPPGPVIVHMPQLHEGIVGIVAGKLSESLKMPAYVFTGKGELKGSGRSGVKGFNLYDFTSTASQFLSRFGGHAGAVGLAVHEKDFNNFRERLERVYHELDIGADDSIYYDIEIKPDEVCEYIEKQKIYEPFGEGIPKPVFLIRNIPLFARYGEYVMYIGKNREHLKFVTKGYSLVGFSMAHQYVQQGKPRTIDVIGRIGINESRYGSFPQVEIIDFSSSM